MNRLTRLALKLFGIRTKRPVLQPRPVEELYTPYLNDRPTFLPADLFKDGGTGDLMVDGIQLSFKDGVVTRLEVNGTKYRVLSAEHNDHDFLASVYNPENTITVRDHLTEAVKRLKVYQP